VLSSALKLQAVEAEPQQARLFWAVFQAFDSPRLGLGYCKAPGCGLSPGFLWLNIFQTDGTVQLQNLMFFTYKSISR